MEFLGKADGKGNMILPTHQAMLRRHYLASMKDGSHLIETIRKVGKPKSNQQVKCHFGLIVAMIRQTMIDLGWGICGVAPNKNMIHDILKKACSGVGDGGECLGLSEMTSEQASQFFKNCQHWAASELKLFIPEPDPNWNTMKGNKNGKS